MKVEEKNNYLVHRKVDASVSELDFVMYDHMFPDWSDENEDEHPNKLIEINDKGIWTNDGNPMLIDDMINILNSLKEKGCNYVEIEDHCDHVGYSIVGCEIRPVTEEEIKKYEEEQTEKENKKQNQIRQNEIEQLNS